MCAQMLNLSSARGIVQLFTTGVIILKGHEQRYHKKLFFSTDSVEFKVQLAPSAVNAI